MRLASTLISLCQLLYPCVRAVFHRLQLRGVSQPLPSFNTYAHCWSVVFEGCFWFLCGAFSASVCVSSPAVDLSWWHAVFCISVRLPWPFSHGSILCPSSDVPSSPRLRKKRILLLKPSFRVFHPQVVFFGWPIFLSTVVSKGPVEAAE